MELIDLRQNISRCHNPALSSGKWYLECLTNAEVFHYSEFNQKRWAWCDNDIWNWNCFNHLVLTLPQLSCLSCDISPTFDDHWQQTNYFPICNHDVERIIMSPYIPADILQFLKVLGCLPLHQMEFLPIKLVQPCLYGHCIVHWFARHPHPFHPTDARL